MSHHGHQKGFQLKPSHRRILCALLPIALLTACAGGADERPEPKPQAKMLTDVLKPAGDKDGHHAQADSHYEQEDEPMTVMVLEELHGFQRPVIAEPEAIKEIPEPLTYPEQNRFHFGFDTAEINEEDKEALQAHAAFLKKHPDYRLKITGHTDAQGPAAYNQRLAQRRAEAVARFLKAAGVDPQQITLEGRGSDAPLADARSAQEQRRVELNYHGGPVASRQ